MNIYFIFIFACFCLAPFSLASSSAIPSGCEASLTPSVSAAGPSNWDRLSKDLPTLVVIDAVSSGADYPVRAKQLFPNIQLIHIQSTPLIPDVLAQGMNPDHFDLSLIYDPLQLDSLVEELSKFQNLHIVTGSEVNPQLRVILANRLHLPASPLDTVKSLNHKYEAASLLRPFVKTIAGEVFSDAASAWAWAKSQNMQLPLLIKPVDASGSFGVHVSETEREFFEAFEANLAKVNPMGRSNDRMLVQPYLSRDIYTEYVIDVVVSPGHQVRIAEVLVYKKQARDGHINYMTTTLVSGAELEHLLPPFQEFSEGVVKGLKIEEGVLHIEAFVNKNVEPPEIVFIEAGARPAGGGIPKFVRACGVTDMITLHLMSLFDREAYKAIAHLPPVGNRSGIQVELVGPAKAGVLASVPSIEEFKQKIPGFLSHALRMIPDTIIGPTEDLFQGAGVINVVGSEEEVNSAEYHLRKWESEDFYRLK